VGLFPTSTTWIFTAQQSKKNPICSPFLTFLGILFGLRQILLFLLGWGASFVAFAQTGHLGRNKGKQATFATRVAHRPHLDLDFFILFVRTFAIAGTFHPQRLTPKLINRASTSVGRKEATYRHNGCRHHAEIS
jgi:hypothetical protein